MISFDKVTFFWFSKLCDYPWSLLGVERLQMLPGTEPCIDRALNFSSKVCVLPFLWVKENSVAQENSKRHLQRRRKLQQQSQEDSSQQRICFLWPPWMGSSALPGCLGVKSEQLHLPCSELCSALLDEKLLEFLLYIKIIFYLSV